MSIGSHATGAFSVGGTHNAKYAGDNKSVAFHGPVGQGATGVAIAPHGNANTGTQHNYPSNYELQELKLSDIHPTANDFASAVAHGEEKLILGQDKDRRKKEIRSNIGLLLTFTGTEFELGSASLLSNDKSIPTIITAAHCFSGKSGEFSAWFFLELDGEANRPASKEYKVKSFVKHPQDLDIALAFLEKSPVSGAAGMMLSKQVPSKGDKIRIQGYPGEEPKRGYQYYHSGAVSELTDEHIIYNDIDATEGQSGSPVLLESDKSTVVGIHTHGHEGGPNWGTLITAPIKEWIQQCLNSVGNIESRSPQKLTPGSHPPDIETFLRKLQLESCLTVFNNEQITMQELVDITPEELKEMGIALGHRKRITKAIQELATIAQEKSA
jgi:hypothetical protein